MEKATGLSKEIISLIQTENIGYEVSISRSVKTGKTAAEVSTVKLEGHAKDKAEALQVLRDLDAATMQFIQAEATFYGVDLKKKLE